MEGIVHFCNPLISLEISNFEYLKVLANGQFIISLKLLLTGKCGFSEGCWKHFKFLGLEGKRDGGVLLFVLAGEKGNIQKGAMKRERPLTHRRADEGAWEIWHLNYFISTEHLGPIIFWATICFGYLWTCALPYLILASNFCWSQWTKRWKTKQKKPSSWCESNWTSEGRVIFMGYAPTFPWWSGVSKIKASFWLYVMCLLYCWNVKW